ncbi:MAG: TetR/AcrR family transcriptional regulator [Thermogutta sp.]|nr:TetR/AcrR family transcriptional regulator [Thermogutta sp.]
MPRLTAIRKRALDEIMKEALFEATVSVLSEQGVDGLTMDRVAAAAGVAKGSLYRYFRGKPDLLKFVYAKMVDPIFQDLDRMAASEQPVIEKLSGQLRGLLEHAASHAQIHKLLFEDEVAHALLQSSERSTVEVASRRLAEVFRQGIEEGVFRPADPLMLARMYLGLCKAVLQSQPELDGCDQRDSVRRLILSTFLDGVAVERGLVG